MSLVQRGGQVACTRLGQKKLAGRILVWIGQASQTSVFEFVPNTILKISVNRYLLVPVKPALHHSLRE